MQAHDAGQAQRAGPVLVAGLRMVEAGLHSAQAELHHALIMAACRATMHIMHSRIVVTSVGVSSCMLCQASLLSRTRICSHACMDITSTSWAGGALLQYEGPADGCLAGAARRTLL
jgi:hypothetical protein